MIFENKLGFLDELNVNVEVFNSNGKTLGRGNLKIKKNKVPIIHLKNYTYQDKNRSFFSCKCDQYTYQLFNCEVTPHSISPEYIIRGSKKRSKFRKAHVLFQGITQWTGRINDAEIDDDEFRKKRKKDFFNVDITQNNKTFKLANEHWCDVRDVSPGSIRVNEYTVLKIEAKKCSFSVEELRSIIHQLRIFFTLILGHPIGIKYIIDSTDKKAFQSMYFINTSKESDDEIKPHDCFVQAFHLFNKDRLPVLLKGYFDHKNDIHRSLWSRVAGMLAYEGFWEYEILAYVSLLDKYVNIDFESEKLTLPKRKFYQYLKKARNALSEIDCPPDIPTETFDKVIECMSSQIKENVKNSNVYSFNDKFDLKVSKTSEEFIKILKLKDEDFIHIKKMRNSIAHGDEPKTQDSEYITYESIIKNKVAILLRYWTFIDIGFSHDEILNFLTNSFNQTTQGAYIDSKRLDIALNRCFFLETNKTNFNIAKKSISNLVLVYVKRTDTFRVDSNSTTVFYEWKRNFNQNKARSIEGELKKHVDTKVIKNILYLGNSYIKHNNESFKIFDLCILNCPEYIYSNESYKNRLREFDSKNNTWLESKFEKRFEQ